MPIKKILITGSNGLLGSNLVRVFSRMPQYSVITTSRNKMSDPSLLSFYQGDLLDEAFVEKLFDKTRPDVVINTVSLVNVDLCEEQPDLAHRITVDTAKIVARLAKNHSAKLLYISTDHLFAGTKSMYRETDIPAPVNMYGKTKSLAENSTFNEYSHSAIIRTNFFGWSPAGHPPTFGEWIYKNLKEQIPMNLFNDYYFTPIEVTSLAEAMDEVITSSFSGILNIAGMQRCSKYEFGMELARVFGLDPSPIRECSVHSATFKARRQQDLSLSTEKFQQTFRYKLPDLRSSIIRFKKTQPATNNKA